MNMSRTVTMCALKVLSIAALIYGCSTLGVNSTKPAFSADLTRAAVRRVMTAAADWQLAHPSKHAPYDWTVAAFYTGMMAFSELSDSPKYYDAMKAMGERNQWRPGLHPGLADDHAVIATYAKIFQREKDAKILAPAMALFDFLVTRPFIEPLTWGTGSRCASGHGAMRSSWRRRRSQP